MSCKCVVLQYILQRAYPIRHTFYLRCEIYDLKRKTRFLNTTHLQDFVLTLDLAIAKPLLVHCIKQTSLENKN